MTLFEFMYGSPWWTTLWIYLLLCALSGWIDRRHCRCACVTKKDAV